VPRLRLLVDAAPATVIDRALTALPDATRGTDVGAYEVGAGAGADGRGDGSTVVHFTIPSSIDGTAAATMTVRGGGHVELSVERAPRLPYFWWVTTPCLGWERRRGLERASRIIRGETVAPPRRGRVKAGPPVPFTEGQAVHLVTVSALLAIATFGGSLFTQNLDYIGDSFGSSDRALGIALAVARSASS
jgi:hypothetical protein